MTRPSKTGGKTSAAKTRKAGSVKGHNPGKTKRRTAPTAIPLERSLVSSLDKELKEAREQQAATADILKVIASSPSDVQPVFEAIAASANRLMGGHSAAVFRFIDGVTYLKAFTPTAPEADQVLRNEFPMPVSNFPLAQQNVLSGETEQIPDTETGKEFQIRIARARGYRSVMFAPLMHRGTAIGMITITRREPGRFADHHVRLLRTFADQAVIAIENARLFNETKEALERQTATSEVLEVINSSPGHLAPVFDAILEKAHNLCRVSHGSLQLYDSEKFRAVAVHGIRETFAERLRQGFVPGPNHPSQQLLKGTRFAQVPDCAEIDDPIVRAAFELGGIRTVLLIPLRKEGSLLGQIAAARKDVSPFTEKEIALLENFAAQAVIAMENARLLGELRERTDNLGESLQQQTATADVLKVISRSTFDLPAVLHALVETAARLCNSDKGTITRQQDGVFYRAESVGFSEEFMEYVRGVPVAVDRHSATGRALLEGIVVHIPDVQADRDYSFQEGQRLGDFRALLGVPMLRNGVPIGVITLTRTEPSAFTQKQIELAVTFADQAAIAIENVRLFDEVQARTQELAKSLNDLRTAQDRLIQTEKLASLGQLTAGIAHEIKNPLNFVNNFSALSIELTDELSDLLKQATLADKLRSEVDELTRVLKNNLGKVVQHGKRADSIVKNMLMHSRESSGERRPADINTLVGESLNLAYHGARAENASFRITLKHELDPEAGTLDLYPQEITRALLNLISNGFYAATKKAQARDESFEPVLSAATRNLGGSLEIRIRDNGTGIPPEVREKMFNPFFTTKPTGEGTGLGLSMTHDIIVKQHGGRIEVETNPGEFTEFIIVLPRDSGGSGSRKPE